MFDYKNASEEELKAEYKRIAEKIGDDEFFTKKELQYLPDALMADEQVLAFTSGIMDGNTWLIALTDMRIIFLDKGMIYGLKQTAIPLEKINSITGSTGIFFGDIEIADGSATHKIENVWKKTVKQFTNLAQEQIRLVTEKSKNPMPVSNSGSGDTDVVTQLEKLAGMLEKGILTQEEFAAQKAKLLG